MHNSSQRLFSKEFFVFDFLKKFSFFLFFMAMKDFFFNFFLLQTGIFKVCSFMFTKKIAFWLHTIFFFAKRRTTAIGNIDFCLIFF